MEPQLTFTALDEAGLNRMAQRVAFYARPGDLILLDGDLGAGKTTFARALLRAFGHPDQAEVPSPTFTLVQTYDTPRMTVAHYDLYRLTDAAELDELGLDDALAGGIAVVEWPERGGTRIARMAEAGNTLMLSLVETPTAAIAADQAPDARDVVMSASGNWRPRAERLAALSRFLAGAGHNQSSLTYLQGDASVRKYARIADHAGALVLMDWPQQPDGPPVRDGRPYSRIAQLAEGVRPFVAIARALAEAGVTVPKVHAADLDAGFLVLDDLGDDVFAALVRTGSPQGPLWTAGVDTLVALRRHAPPVEMALDGGSVVHLPSYDATPFGIETELLLDWYWPALHGSAPSAAERARYLAIWAAIFERLARQPKGWVLRDYHSPNLIRVPTADGGGHFKTGVIDFQDAQIGPHAYDLVSLLQDARVDVPPALETELLDRYCARVQAADPGIAGQGLDAPGFDEAEFRFAYAALGAQRNCKILGIFARLAHRDGKPAYLAHVPRLWGYLARDLDHPGLADLKAWFVTAFPPGLREQPISPSPPVRMP